jgi:hypothetical protein
MMNKHLSLLLVEHVGFFGIADNILNCFFFILGWKYDYNLWGGCFLMALIVHFLLMSLVNIVCPTATMA